MNNSTQWLYQQFHSCSAMQDMSASCYLCASPCTEQYRVTHAIADTFNSHYLAACPSSPFLCVACQWYFDSKANHPDFRKMSLIVACDAWRNWERAMMKADIAHWLDVGLEQDAYLVVSLSKKKHILLQAPMNTRGSTHLAIQVEEQVAHCTRESWAYIDKLFMALLQLGHGKGEILSGNLYGSMFKKHGQYAKALLLSEQLVQWRQSPLIELISYTTIIEGNEQIHDGDGTRPDGHRSDARTIDTARADDAPTGTRVMPVRRGIASGHMERNRPRLSEQVSRDDLDAIRGASSRRQQDHEQLSLFSE